MNIAEYSSATLTLDWLRITMGYVEGFDRWFRSGVMCACDDKVLIGCHSNPVLESM